ncbi:hypothetical protein [Lactococcus lactis]
MYETFTIDPTKKQDTFNLIEYVNSMESEDKYDSLNLLFHRDLPVNSWLFDKSYVLEDQWDFLEELSNYVFYIGLLEFGEKFAWSNLLYHSGSSTCFYPNRLTVTNFFIQEYRASQSKNISEYLEKDFKIPMLFPICISDYETISNMAEDDNDMYDCPISEKRNLNYEK